MYVRPPQGYRYPNSVRVPENYGGSTFREAGTQQREQAEGSALTAPEPDRVSEQKSEAESAGVSEKQEKEREALLRPPFRLRLPSLFGKDRGTGSEELLILALILLLADSDEGFDDLVLFLVLLFFIK